MNQTDSTPGITVNMRAATFVLPNKDNQKARISWYSADRYKRYQNIPPANRCAICRQLHPN